ncbi:MAG: phosphodiester glycosidase family protein, partial [Oscillospiraceae bacterium]|nr:phosphodiester glycosidase family protein [Oscillospiraceae bacterium]
SDLVDIMLDFGAVNAMNLDGGSSTVMILNGELVNSPSSATGYSRGLPNAIMFK